MLTPNEAAVVTQIILKDLRPLLYPLPADSGHYTTALLRYKSNAVTMLTKGTAMRVWDSSGRMAAAFRQRANLEEAAMACEEPQCGSEQPEKIAYIKPSVGSPIQVRHPYHEFCTSSHCSRISSTYQIPKCVKGQGCAHALHTLRGAEVVWAETKYDGERAQIHVELRAGGTPKLTIYSKSGRESTLDRAGVHSYVAMSSSLQCLIKWKSA